MLVIESLLNIWQKQGHRVLLFTQSRQVGLIYFVYIMYLCCILITKQKLQRVSKFQGMQTFDVTVYVIVSKGSETEVNIATLWQLGWSLLMHTLYAVQCVEGMKVRNWIIWSSWLTQHFARLGVLAMVLLQMMHSKKWCPWSTPSYSGYKIILILLSDNVKMNCHTETLIFLWAVITSLWNQSNLAIIKIHISSDIASQVNEIIDYWFLGKWLSWGGSVAWSHSLDLTLMDLLLWGFVTRKVFLPSISRNVNKSEQDYWRHHRYHTWHVVLHLGKVCIGWDVMWYDVC
jgi:hypothetical protein